MKAADPDPGASPGSGWWQASDGNWYAPELHPDSIATIAATRPGRSAVTRAAGASAPGGLSAPERTTGQDALPAADGKRPPAPPDLDFDPMNDPATLFGSLDGPAPSAVWTPAENLAETGPSTGQIPVSPPTMPIPVTPASAAPGAVPAPATLPAPPPGAAPIPMHAAANGPSPAAGASPSGTAFRTGAPPPGESPASALAPAASNVSRPVNPGFGKMNTPPPGSTVREEFPKPQLRQQGTASQLPRSDGFDEFLLSVLKPAAPTRSAPVVRPPQPPPQRLMGVSDVLSHVRTTSGGPASAVPRMSSREADFFVMKPSNKKAKTVRTAPRTKLSGFIFLFVLLVVLAAVALFIVFGHVHVHT